MKINYFGGTSGPMAVDCNNCHSNYSYLPNDIQVDILCKQLLCLKVYVKCPICGQYMPIVVEVKFL